MIFFVNTGEEMAAAARVKRRRPLMIVMVRLLDSRATVDSTRAVFASLPEIFHTDRVRCWRLLMWNEVGRLHAFGPKVYVNALPVEQRGWTPLRQIALDRLLATGVDFVLTGDAPVVMRKLAGVSRS